MLALHVQWPQADMTSYDVASSLQSVIYDSTIRSPPYDMTCVVIVHELARSIQLNVEPSSEVVVCTIPPCGMCQSMRRSRHSAVAMHARGRKYRGGCGQLHVPASNACATASALRRAGHGRPQPEAQQASKEGSKQAKGGAATLRESCMHACKGASAGGCTILDPRGRLRLSSTRMQV